MPYTKLHAMVMKASLDFYEMAGDFQEFKVRDDIGKNRLDVECVQ